MCLLRSEWGGRAGRSSRQGEMWAGPEQARPPWAPSEGEDVQEVCHLPGPGALRRRPDVQG